MKLNIFMAFYAINIVNISIINKYINIKTTNEYRFYNYKRLGVFADNHLNKQRYVTLNNY